jgi:hypothetical protein
MLTLKAMLRERKIYVQVELPDGDEHKILVNILDEEAGDIDPYRKYQ